MVPNQPDSMSARDKTRRWMTRVQPPLDMLFVKPGTVAQRVHRVRLTFASRQYD